jgi:regulator of protease activity HflC (stomatin/prohibitin superfamily)
MKTQTDRKIAEELQRTYEMQRMAEVKRQDLQRELAIANIQAEVVRSEQQVRISEQNARAQVESARGEALSVKARAEAEAESVRMVGLAKAEAEAQTVLKVGAAKAEAEAELVLKVGAAKAEAHRQGQEALGAAGYTAVQIASILGEHHVKLVPDISVGSASAQSGGLAEVLIGRMLASGVQGLPPPVPPQS